MEKIYVLGAGNNSVILATLKAEHPETEIILVDNREDIPIGTGLDNINEVFTLTNQRIDIKPLDYEYKPKKGKKGYERPYKYHK